MWEFQGHHTLYSLHTLLFLQLSSCAVSAPHHDVVCADALSGGSAEVQHRFLGELHLLQLQLLRRNCLCWAFLTRFKIWSSIWMDKLSPWNFRLFTLSTTFLSIERRRWAELPVLLKSMINTLVLLVLSTRLLFPISQVHMRAVCHCQSPGPYSRRQV